MPRFQASGKLAGALLAISLLGSCGIRLPIASEPPPPTLRTPVRAEPPAETPAENPHVLVWLIADSYHTGMVFPYDWLLESGYVPPEDFGNPKFVTLSWGNQDAYSEAGMDSYWKIFRVLFTPTRSVMELIPIRWDVVNSCPHHRIWRKLAERDDGPALANFLNKCSKTGADGRPIVISKSSWGNGVQLQSRHPYFIPRVCNVWTVQTIEALGGEINPWFALTADGLVREAEKPPNNFELIWSGNTYHP